jgi:RNA polymerase primary sigma factor
MPRTATRRDTVSPSQLQIYLQEINVTPLLSAEEERELAQRIGMGDPEARDHMVKANLRLVVNIARGYLNRGMCLEDLIEEGNLGLMRAVEGYDGAMATRFSTYASFWIKQSIRRAVMNNGSGRPIRLPAYLITLLAKWRRVAAMLGEEYGRPATLEEVGAVLKLSKKKLAILRRAIEVHNLTPHPDAFHDDLVLLEGLLTDDRGKAPDEVLMQADMLEQILQRLDGLDEREALVVRMRFGLEPYSPMTLREVGERLGLTRERVRQLESHALSRLMAESFFG